MIPPGNPAGAMEAFQALTATLAGRLEQGHGPVAPPVLSALHGVSAPPGFPARVDAPVPFDHQWVASGSGIPHTVSRAPASPPCHRSVPVPTQTRVPAVSLAPVGPPVSARTVTSLSGISLHPASEFSDSGSAMGHDDSTGHSPGTSRPPGDDSSPEKVELSAMQRLSIRETELRLVQRDMIRALNLPAVADPPPSE